MDAGAEGDVLLVDALGFESVGLAIGSRIAIGGAQQQPDLLARPDRDTGFDLDRLIGVATEHVQRRVVAYAFLDGRRRSSRPGEKAARVAALVQDRADCIAGLVDRRLVARVQELDGRRRQLCIRQPVAAVPRRDQHGEQVVSGCLAPLLDIAGEEIGEFARRCVGAHLDLAGTAEHVHGDHVVRPVEQLVVHAGGNAEHLGNHGDRHRRGERGKKIGLSVDLDAVDQGVGQALDHRPQPFHLPRDEGAVDQHAKARVRGRFQFQHRMGGEGIEIDEVIARAGIAVLRRALRLLAPETPVAQETVDVVMTGEAPETVLLPEEGRSVGVEEGVGTVGILHERRGMWVQACLAASSVEREIGRGV